MVGKRFHQAKVSMKMLSTSQKHNVINNLLINCIQLSKRETHSNKVLASQLRDELFDGFKLIVQEDLSCFSKARIRMVAESGKPLALVHCPAITDKGRPFNAESMHVLAWHFISMWVTILNGFGELKERHERGDAGAMQAIEQGELPIGKFSWVEHEPDCSCFDIAPIGQKLNSEDLDRANRLSKLLFSDTIGHRN